MRKIKGFIYIISVVVIMLTSIVIIKFVDLSYFNEHFIKIVPLNIYIVSGVSLVWFLGLCLFYPTGPTKTVFTKTVLTKMLIIVYSFFMFQTLYLRQNYQEYQFVNGHYMMAWWRLIFKNPIVFINIIGNIIIYIPLGVVVTLSNKKYKYLIVLVTVVMLELIQYITKTGIFDMGDIFLNYIGSTIGFYIAFFFQKIVIRSEDHG